jgi:SAM-dependent methyltransferase
VEWKAGAESYVRELVARGGAAFRQWHLTKPFLGEPLEGDALHGDASRPAVDPHVTFHELFAFLNALRAAAPRPGARILDVGCGPGWTAHLLGKMGYSVLGFDISEEMLSFARERVAKEPFPPHPRTELDVRFVQHDIEAAPLGEKAGEPFDLALLDSVLHHFEDPLAAMRHVGESLREDALVAIIEALHPEGAPVDPTNLAIMERYHTIERPYTESQLADVLRLAGFPHQAFLFAVNGLAASPEEPLPAVAARTILAARRPDALKGWGGLRFIGFHDEERDARGPFRWARPTSGLVLDGSVRSLTFSSMAAGLGREKHDVFVSVNGALATVLRFAPGAGELSFATESLKPGTRLSFHSDYSFCPKLLGMNPDERVLAFQLRWTPV